MKPPPFPHGFSNSRAPSCLTWMRRPSHFPAATAHEWGGKAGRPSEPAGSTRSRSGRDGSRSSCEEVGSIPFDPEAAALLFALVSSRYERTSLILQQVIFRAL